MKRSIFGVLAISALFGSLLLGNSAYGGQISSANATITWDDGSFYEPVSCSIFKFDVVVDSSIWYVDLQIKNKYGDIVASSSTTYGSGQSQLQVCKGKDLTDTLLVATVTTHKVVKSVFEKPIKFLPRSSSSPSATASPAPTPTVTITAVPSPAPTVYLTSPEDQSLRDMVIALQGEVKSLKAKVKRICGNKPKPRGC